jgi:hypothetical protein
MHNREQEALSKRYAFRASVTPLSDGSFAVFALDLSAGSMLIVENPDDLALAIMSRANTLERKTLSQEEMDAAAPQLDFDDLDFTQA